MTIDRIVRAVAAHRAHVGDARPYPPAGDCILFSITEAGELIDALLRQTPRYLRNNAKQMDPAAEAGDLGYMIASAIDQIDNQQQMDVARPAVLTAQILDRLSYALIAIDRGQHSHARKELIGALETWQELCRRENWNPDNLIADVAARVNARWRAPAPDADLPTFVADEVKTA